MRPLIYTALLSALITGAALVGSANAVTVDGSSNLTDSLLNNQVADGGPFGIGATALTWSASFGKKDKRGWATFQVHNNTGQAHDVTVAIKALLSGLKGKFKGGVSASWIGGGGSAELADGQFGMASMQKQFADGETASLQIRFGKAKVKGGSLGLNVSVTVPDLMSGNSIPSGGSTSGGTQENTSKFEKPIITLPGIDHANTSEEGSLAPSAVPLPAGWLLMLTGLVGGGLLASRRGSLASA